tara:strand:+ start:6843 stop:7070 length:228 start_codon:yes stop_codon:yes gene_type:complete
MTNLPTVTVLKSEIEWLEENSGKVPRLKRKIAREHLNDRVVMLEEEEATLNNAKKVLASETKIKRGRPKKEEIYK